MRYFLASFLLCCVVVLSIAGFRGDKTKMLFYNGNRLFWRHRRPYLWQLDKNDIGQFRLRVVGLTIVYKREFNRRRMMAI